ncbi:serine-protein kinase ATM isoform X1 [Prionailurus bengalensis]|uniref:serine-protein kinase ATM isoform X1 n=1 Tax=Prionailurus bengalensis TaxID=37029 RepID=UPI001CA92EB1|nr:serine-protein kinase ATM isoform X1 [Prionailurus bengalensis]XP_043435186.1 serine-protein kinase ATM isoform X1 [Prionailurus bengalensis]XP_043435187.1 serine-protein kinase ATM isoform X1 [Prionailurus bengalensis]
MSLALNDLLICCRQLEHDRATERRKEVEKFKRLIRDPETVQHLDRHSDSKQGKYLNWDAVFRFLQKYVQKETECLRTAKAGVSASTQATRQKKMQEISSLVKYFIKCANKRAPRLKCQELLNYIMDTVKDSFNGTVYGADCSNILLKDILSVRKYWCEITQQQWLELFSVYFNLYLKPAQDINRVLVARIIHAVARGCCSQTDGLNSKLLDFFSKAIHHARQEKSSAGLNHILAAFVIFLKTLAVNFRICVCQLGDEVLPTLLYIWTQHRLNDCLKEVIIELFQLQIYIRHPKGAKTQEKGAYESNKWKSILYNLYDLLINEISHIGSRGKYSSGSRNVAVKENLIDLMADICHQVFNEDTRSLEISQSYAITQRELNDYGATCKKRKIELGWDVIKDHLQKSQNDFDLVPWLQIATQLISKYPSSLPNYELSPLLMILYQLLPQQRHGERTPYVLRCLVELASCQGKKSDLESSQKSDLLKLWTKIWSITFRGISSERIQAENFGLLGAIIQGGLIEVDREFWKLFTGSACRPSCPAVCCLTLALTICVVPETVKTGVEQNTCEVNRSFSLKELIMKWLLFYQLEDDFEDSTEPPPVLHSNFPHLALEKILVSLTMKNSKAAMNFFQRVPECEQHHKDAEESSFSEIEELFLQTTFDKMDFLTIVKECPVEKLQSSGRISVHQNLKESLDRCLLGLSEQLLNNYSFESTDAETLIRCSSLVVGVLGCYCYMGVIAEEEAYKSELFQKAKSLMQCAGESITVFKNKPHEESRIVSLRNLMHLCTRCLSNCTRPSPNKIASGFFLRLLTSKLMNDIADICRSLASFSRKPFDYGEVESVEDDPDESLMEAEDQSSMSLFSDYPAGSVSDANASGEGQSTIGAMNPLAEEHLSKQDLLFLDMLKFLCMCVTSAQTSTVSFRAADIRRRLLMLIDSSMLDPAKSLHLHMYLVLLKELPGEEHPLPMEEVVELLKPLSNVCSLYRRDQDVCKTVLNHVVHIVMNLCQGSMDAENTRDAQGQFLTVIGAFWHLAKEGKCTFSVRMALVKCLKTLLEADPYSKWAILNVMGKEFPVNEVFPHFLADNHHQVSMLAAESINRLFQDMKNGGSSTLLKALPLKLQQTAFENAYSKAQEGMREVAHRAENTELVDEVYNRKSVLLMTVAVILCCSPVCEKQALFALCKAMKESGLEPHLIKKVLEKVSETFGYRHLEDFMASHLDYLVLEWLNLQDTEHSLCSFPFILLNYTNVEDFYRSCYKVLIPHLVIRSRFDEVKSIANQIQEDWKTLLTHCFPKILVNILPYFAYEGTGESETAQQRETATKVYDTLKDENLLGKQIDHLFLSNLPEIVVELLMTLHEPATSGGSQSTDLGDFSGDLDPAPNPPHFPSHVIKATFAYISNCHKTKLKSILEILSKSPDSYQKILLAICEQAAETNNVYKKHRILKIYHLFVSLLLKDIKSTLGGAWAFVLRDVIYTLIHYINKRPSRFMDVSLRSFSLCCDLLSRVCHTAVTYCKDALENHLHVIVGTLIPLVDDQMEVQEQVLDLLKYLVIDNKDNENLYMTIKLLDPFPDHDVFKDLRLTQQKIKYSKGPFSLLEEINHFLSVSVYDALPLTRLEGLKDLRRQLAQHKDQMMDLMRASQENPQDGIMVKLIVSLLQLCKMAVSHTGEREVLEAVGSCLGEVGPIDFSTIAIQHSRDTSSTKALEFFEDKELQWTFLTLTYLNNTLVEDCVKVRSAAVTCLKSILATKTGHTFWEIYKTTTDPMLIYLQPFRTSRKKFLEVPRLDKESPLEGLDDTSLWTPQSGNHDSWIKRLTCAFLDSGGTKSEILQLLKPMCEVKTDFCQTVLPYLIHDILLQDTNESWRTLLSTHIQGFFTNCFRHSSQTSRSTTPANLDSDSEHFFRCCVDKKSQRTMLAVVDYMRRQRRPSLGTVFDDAFWLELNYLEVAKVAQSCAAHFTALLYAEIYADKKSTDDQEKRCALVTNRSLMFEEASQNTTISSLSEKSKEETGISLQDLLLEIYRSIGEPDSLYGCGGGKMLQPLTRLRTYEHEAMWGKALVTYDLETAISSSTRQAGIIQALQNLGLCHILSVYLKGLDLENKEWCAELQELCYQAAWRNMQWDHCVSANKGMEGTSYHESVYNALQSLRDREFSTFYESLKYARVREVEELCRGSLESVYSLYPTLSRLQAIGELENIGELFSRSVPGRQPSEVYAKWRKHSQLLKDSDFSFQEPIMALRTVILEILMEKEMENSQRECFKDILTTHLVELSILARTFKNTQLPERAIFHIKQYNPPGRGVSEWQLEEAQVFWARNERSLALSVLKQMIKKLDSSGAENDPSLRLLYTECLRVCGTWLAETCLENPAVIMQTYLEKAVEVAGNYDGESSDELRNGKMKAFLSLARFSDTQYQRIENYMKSSEFENKQALLKRAKEEVGLLREHKIQTTRYTIKVQRELELDECALRALKEDRKRFLCKAVENYISCLLSGEAHDMWIFRLCSLWLENSGVSEVNGMMKSKGMNIPSYKFLPLMYQLAARMGTKMMGGLGFHEVLNNLISTIAMDHPHHTLFIILALANANKDEFLTKPEAARRSRISKNAPKQSSQLDEDRTEAANRIICTIRSRRPHMVRSVEALCDAYIILANLDATQWRTQRKGINIPADQPITKLKNLEDVVVPTMEIKVDPTGEYGNLVTIQSFKAEFHLAGGLNLPKIIDCLGSDGKERRQLVKGRDDLRQDAVMQQVFQMCNTLLQRNTETRKRKLTICTYKVVPLSQRSGVLEWCTGTVPIGEFLVNNENGAHKRYRPKDFSALQCQKKMMDVQKKSFEEKYKTFTDICQNFQPVFRYFCMEKFLDPAVWFEKRLAYTRSVATSSIVGYILGLGDRHVQNILINEQSAELVHIDLGVAFEQGKILPTPETVPFRLTRDIVDGMGITGVEGVFRRCCEKTMEVMRSSQETLLTIVEVLLYDPLFDWTMNPLKALYLQQRPEDDAELHSTPSADDQECRRGLGDIDQSLNKVAERVLMRLQEKLKGVEEGTVLSVRGQVNLLIQQAMDPKNLSRLFPGWKAWV